MRPALVFFVANAATAVLISCNKPDALRPEPVSPSSTDNPLELLTSRIDTTVTLGAWLTSHPSDKISEIPVVDGVKDEFCRAAVAETQLSGRTFVRSALFYIPTVPKGERLPADTAKVAENLCELRTIALTSEEMEFPSGHALRDSIALLISKRLGAHRDSLKFSAGGIRGMPEGKMWNGPGTTVVIATAPGQIPRATESEGESGDSGTARTPLAKVFVVAYAPGGAQDFDLWQSRYMQQAPQRAADRKWLYHSVDSAIAWAELPGVAADLKTVVTYLRGRNEDEPNQRRPAEVDSALLRALRATREAAPSLPVPRRAAALLAADIALFATFPMLGADSVTPLRRDLTSLGITFDDLPISEAVQNTRPWLWEAYRLDSLGRAGGLAFVELLAQGWTTRGACNESGLEYARMIEQGERRLNSGDNNPLIHYYVASAYKTIYDLANYGESEYFDSNAAKPQAESARLKGITHYRAALESLSNPVSRREAWTKAMRLLLRRSGEQPEYLCFYD